MIEPDPRIKKVLEKLKEQEEFKALPKCTRCGSQLRDDDGDCICKRFFEEDKE